jgi:hypothetical protein
MSFLLAFVLSHFCETPTAWAEHTPSGWIAVCGDDDGNRLWVIWPG